MKNQVALINIKKLKPHKTCNRQGVIEVKRQIKRAGFFRKPVIADRKTLVILDGHHRVEALRALGCRKIPVFLIDYRSSKVKIYLRRKELAMKILKGAVLAKSSQGQVFPNKTTRHFLPKRPVTRIPIEKLRSQTRKGVKRLATKTGAGQWGSALAMACRFFDLECLVFMVRISHQQKPYRRVVMESFGAKVIPSPSEQTESGKQFLAEDPKTNGSLGMAISEAVEVAATHEDTKYSLGSVLNHVLLHQTVIGLEAKKQLAKIELYPDIIIGCCGGGSNLSGHGLLDLSVYDDYLRGQIK